MPRLQQYSCESGVGSKEIEMSIFGDMRKTRSAQQDKDLKRRESRDKKTGLGENNNGERRLMVEEDPLQRIRQSWSEECWE